MVIAALAQAVEPKDVMLTYFTFLMVSLILPDAKRDDLEPARADGGIGPVGPRGCDEWIQWYSFGGCCIQGGYCIRARGHQGPHSLSTLNPADRDS